jgi:hypothetical protein
MSVTKRILGDFNISNKDVVGANITISTHTLTIDGNLLVGNITNATVTNTSVEDNIIVLNRGETGAGVTMGNAGIEIDRGSLTNVGIRYNENIDSWQLTNDGITYASITSGSASAIGNVFQDPAPRISGNLEITSKTLFDTIANVEIRANTAAMGGSGVYTNKIGVTNNRKELITKNRALVYSIIL